MSIPLLYRLIIKDKFVVDNGIFSAILGNVTQSNGNELEFAPKTDNGIKSFLSRFMFMATSLQKVVALCDNRKHKAAVPFLRAAPNQEAVMLQTNHKYNIIGTYGTAVTIYDEPRPRHARPNDITRGKNGAYYRFVASDGRLRLYDVTADVKAMQRVLRGKSMEQVLSDVEREEKLSQYRQSWKLRRAVAQ